MNGFVVFTFCILAVTIPTLNIWFGFWLASNRKRLRRVTPSAMAADPVAQQAALDRLVEQAFQVCTLSQNGQYPESVSLAIAELGRVAQALERCTSPKIEGASANRSFDLTTLELQTLTTEPDGTTLTSDGNLCNERRPYPTWQYVAPSDETLPDPTIFKEVFCHDISVGGMSYLSSELPTYAQVCISVGAEPDWLLLEAKVVNYRCVEYKGLPMFLVGCRFSRRLGSFSEVWPGKKPEFGQPVSIRLTRKHDAISHPTQAV